MFPGFIKKFRNVRSPNDCAELQSNMDFIQGWCTVNCITHI